MNLDIKNMLFWIFLTVGLVLLLWNVFGKSPTEFIALVTLIFTVLLKTWSISDKQIKQEMSFKALVKDFQRLAGDFKEHIKP